MSFIDVPAESLTFDVKVSQITQHAKFHFQKIVKAQPPQEVKMFGFGS